MIGGEIGGYHRAEQAQCLMKAAEEDIKFIRPIKSNGFNPIKW